MDNEEYLKLIREEYEKVISDYKTSSDKKDFENIFLETAKNLIITKDGSIEEIYNQIIEDYLKSVEGVSKLSPGLSAGLYDEKENIILNTYNGKMSDIPNDDNITEETVFDASSVTKMFTSILILKEAEKGNIDLNRKFSDYSKKLKKVEVPIGKALKFGVDLRTNGRLDEKGISNEERIERFKNTYIYEPDTYIYSDIPYMLVPLLFGKTMEEATENYLKKFYDFYRGELGLKNTGYSQVNMTGGRISTYLKENKFTYEKDGLYDPKADIFERKIGYVSGHAGVTTTVKDLEKLFKHLSTGLLNKESLKYLVTPVQTTPITLLDKEGKPVIRDGKEVNVNHAMGVYINTGHIRTSDVQPKYSDNAFAAQGSTGTYSVFDIENGLNMTYLSNIRSGLYYKWINTDGYTYGDIEDEIPKHFQTTLISGTGTIKDGRIIRPDGSFMPYARATNNFKEEGLETLLKLRVAKKVLTKKAKIELTGTELEEKLKEIEDVFSQKSPKQKHSHVKYKKR